MSTFGQVTYGDAPTEAAPSPGEQPSLIDPNDPRLTSERITENLDADAYAVPPPPPDGKWRVKAKQVDITDKKTGQALRYLALSYPKMANGRPFFATNIEFSLIDHSGKFDGVKLTEYHVKTLVDDRRGISQATFWARKAGAKLTAPPRSDKEAIDILIKALAVEPELIIETAWSAECQTCQDRAKAKGERSPRPFLQGMHRFPATKVPGENDPMVKCTGCGSMVRAQVRIVTGFALTETQPTRGTGNAAAK